MEAKAEAEEGELLVRDEFSVLCRDLYALYPLLIRYVDNNRLACPPAVPHTPSLASGFPGLLPDLWPLTCYILAIPTSSTPHLLDPSPCCLWTSQSHPLFAPPSAPLNLLNLRPCEGCSVVEGGAVFQLSITGLHPDLASLICPRNMSLCKGQAQISINC